jgi:ElaB/YqjD/DUF883 family membrane-anchored ribosome-binding protein
MPSNQGEPKTLAEAIARLERATQSKTQEFRDVLGKDFSELRKAMDDIKPHLEGIGSQVKDQVGEARRSMEAKVQENPWMTLAIAGIFGLVLGWIFGFSSRRD